MSFPKDLAPDDVIYIAIRTKKYLDGDLIADHAFNLREIDGPETDDPTEIWGLSACVCDHVPDCDEIKDITRLKSVVVGVDILKVDDILQLNSLFNLEKPVRVRQTDEHKVYIEGLVLLNEEQEQTEDVLLKLRTRMSGYLARISQKGPRR